MTDPALSIVIPLYNEAENIEPLYAELSAALDEIGCTYEVIAVDDGSRDDSFARLKSVHERDPRWRVIRFRRNFGQTAALSAGFDQASGDVIIAMDGDLQHQPEDVPRFIEKIAEGNAVNIGTGRLMTFLEVARLFARLAGYEPEIIPQPDKPQGVVCRYADTTRMRALLGWFPRITVEEGFARVLAEQLEAVQAAGTPTQDGVRAGRMRPLTAPGPTTGARARRFRIRR